MTELEDEAAAAGLALGTGSTAVVRAASPGCGAFASVAKWAWKSIIGTSPPPYPEVAEREASPPPGTGVAEDARLEAMVMSLP